MRISAAISLLLIAGHAPATTINIPLDYPTIQAGIDAALDGDTVRVHPGTYFETEIGYNGKAIVVTSLDPDDSLTVAATVVSGSGIGRPFHFRAGEDSTSVLVGVTITEGHSDSWGGGMVCSYASPTIDRCRIVRNEVDDESWPWGGGLVCEASSSRIIRTTIAENTIGADEPSYDGRGGGVTCMSGAPVFIDCLIERNRNNSLDARGGGIYSHGADVTLSGVTLRGNHATQHDCFAASGSAGGTIRGGFATGHDCAAGGGLFLDWDYWVGDLRILVRDCTIVDNLSTNGGGAYLSSGRQGKVLLNRCVIRYNRAHTGGAGIWASINEEAELRNCLISGNRVGSYPRQQNLGGGIRASYSNVVLRNCTIANNSAPDGGGGIYSYFASPSVTSSILWGNQPNEITAFGDSPDITWSTIRGEWPGEGNLYRDPLFRDPEKGNWRLRSAECGFDDVSPAIDGADPTTLDRHLDCASGQGALRADQGAFGGGACGLEIVNEPDPLIAFLGDSLTGALEIANWCDDTLAFDRVRIESLGSPALSRTVYSGREVVLGEGESVQQSFALPVPARIPTGVYRTRMVVLSGSSPRASSDRIVVVRSEEPLRINVPDDVSSIQQAIQLAIASDTVVIAPGTHREGAIDFEGKAVTVRGEDPSNARTVAATVVDGSGVGSVFIFESDEDSNSVLAGLTITGGRAREGGGIRCLSSPLVEDCVIRGNWSTSHDTAPVGAPSQLYACGGGVFCRDGAPIFRRCEIVENRIRVEALQGDGRGAGVYCEAGAPRFEQCRIDRNRSEALANLALKGAGAACSWNTHAIFIGCSFDDNQILADGDWSGDQGQGGGLYFISGEADLVDCTLSRNRIDAMNHAMGGGLFLQGSADTRVTLTHCRVEENAIAAAINARGAGIHAGRGQLQLFDCILSDNSTFSDSRALGGGLYAYGTDLTLIRCDLLGNTCSHDGGGAWTKFGNSLFSGSILAHNAASRGGGLYLSGDALLENCTFKGNQASDQGTGIFAARG